MENVWGELKKIEADAEQIRTEAQSAAKSIIDLAKKNGEKLVANSQIYSDAEAQQLYTNTVNEANRDREEQLKANKVAIEKLQVNAEKQMDAAVSKVVKVLVEET